MIPHHFHRRERPVRAQTTDCSESRGLIAITGANGTIGYHSTLYALRIGYRVRCIVRREDAVSTIKSWPPLREYSSQVEYALVPENTIPGAYDEAITGAKYVVHIAGVWPKPHYHPDNEIYYPFVKSMENVLRAAEKSGTVRRIVFTQAGAGLVSPQDGDTLGTRMNEVLNEFIKVNPHSATLRPPLASPHRAYSAAKAYCMSYLRSLKTSNLPFSIVQVIPGTAIGPSNLISSSKEAFEYMDRMSKALLFNDVTPRYAFGFVQLEDCARVHVEALDETKVPDESIPDWFIAAASTKEGLSGGEVWREAGDMVEREFRDEVERGVFVVGRDNVPVNMPFRVDSKLTERLLFEEGKGFKGFEECVREVGRWYADLAKMEEDVIGGG
ncbi:3-beta hydroxysteroid dehydrogenase/isomerase family protein [Zopfia rhizophila CBS 207.26]|uniref:3-beta hydroxysteroid dehydrogenase/isomerase family protein n=1 Tax=Zopfia rhizophila CBS 207.26 TaxID=1314779 RepID=A0A6A6ELD1_9PEZI|nr:3-beta hydroxysteroid dehydrogenase/isomerase family protein [Zopfia rhizophila CBS 207.26]